MESVGCDPGAWERVRERSDVLTFFAGPFCFPAASILKQSMLSGGADALVHRLVLTCDVEDSGVLIYGTEKNLKAGCASLKKQPFGLPALADQILSALSVPDPPDSLKLGGDSLVFEGRPIFMGVLNCTPDSFSDGGLLKSPEQAVEHGLNMHLQGAAIIDVGGESTRPGALPTPPDEQMRRVIPVIEGLRRAPNLHVSIDTSETPVARAAIQAGAEIINSVNGMDTPGMVELAAETGAAVILMHMKGTPATMQNSPDYDDVLSEVAFHLGSRISRLVAGGVDRERILVDPGIGFGKRPWHNLRLIQSMGWLRSATGCRVVLGHSRKSFLGLLSGISEPARRDFATALVSALSVGGADVLRVHNVEASVRAVSAAMEGSET
jgi:dihydropteroate synthase